VSDAPGYRWGDAVAEHRGARCFAGSIDFGAKYKMLDSAFPAKDIIYRA